MNRQTILLLFAGFLIGLAIGIAFFFGFNRDSLGSGTGSPDSESSGATVFAPEKGSAAPQFALESLAGETIQLSDLRGKVVLLNFWATWCAPCRIEMPALQSRHERWSDELAVLAIDFDEPKEAVQAFADELGLTFTILLDPGGSVQNAYRVRGYPTTIFLDEGGVVQIVHIGIMSEDQLDAYLENMGVVE